MTDRALATRPTSSGGARVFRPRPAADAIAAVLGCVLVVVALAIIWTTRSTVDREIYVSELGAEGMASAPWFQAALTLIAIGGSAIAWAGRRVRAAVPILSAWTPAVSLWIGCALFLFASRVTCTAGCPLPYGSTFTWQDFLHTTAAVLAFAAACWAMLQSSFSRENRVLAVLSGATGILVAVIAGAGGILSLLRFQQGLGSYLEFFATTLAISWLVMFGLVTAIRTRRPLVTAPSA